MAHEQAKRAAHRILDGIENGTMTASESRELVEESDPALVYFIFTWLRKRYADHVNADAVLGRLLAVSDHDSVKRLMKEGQEDSIVGWFEDGYSYRDLDADDFIELIVDKLEG